VGQLFVLVLVRVLVLGFVAVLVHGFVPDPVRIRGLW